MCRNFSPFILLVKVFKCENTFFFLSSPRVQISKTFGHPNSGSGGKKTFKRYLKSERTYKKADRHTDGHFDFYKASAQRADALKILAFTWQSNSNFLEFLVYTFLNLIYFINWKSFQPNLKSESFALVSAIT